MPSQGQHTSHPYVNIQAVNQQRIRILGDLLRSPSNTPDLRSLPETLTQEQLDRLDSLTREAIDERLRVLQDVQDTLWRCGESLLQVKSLLPAPSRSGLSSSQGQESGHNNEGNSKNAFDRKGKTKATPNAYTSSSRSDSASSSSTSEDSGEVDSDPVSETSVPATLAQPAEYGASAIIPEVCEGVEKPGEPTQ